MRTYDLSPLYRSTIGFDRLFSLLDQVSGVENGTPTYPPYNIERTGENAYRITLAVAGFTDKDLSIEVKENALAIRGDKQAAPSAGASDMLYQGIAARAFEHGLQLADLVRTIPETLKPRSIPIASGSKSVEVNGGEARSIEAKAA